MIREVCIIIFAVCCVFSIIPLTWLLFPGPVSGPVLSMALLIIVLFYAAYDVMKLVGNREYGLARNFVLLLIVSVTLSFFALIQVWRYVGPPTVQVGLLSI